MSYGQLDNQNTSNWYPFHPGVPVSVNAGGWLVNGQRPTVASAPPLVSSLLTWERVESWNAGEQDRKSTRLNSSHVAISYAVFCLKKKNRRYRRRAHTHCARPHQ